MSVFPLAWAAWRGGEIVTAREQDREPGSASCEPGSVRGLVQEIVYSNPDYIPPIINEVRTLAGEGFTVSVLCREYERRWGIQYPGAAQIVRVSAPGSSSLQEYARFILRAFRWADSQTIAFVGHDMHGFLVARLLGWRFRRPVIYRCHDFVEREPGTSLGRRAVMTFQVLFARTADVVVVPDRERGNYIQQALHLDRPPLMVANAPLHPALGPSGGLRSALRAEGREFSRIVLRQGRIGPGHAIEATIRSIPFWADRTWGLVLLGVVEPDYKRMLLELAATMDVESQVAILPPVRYDDVALYTFDADVGHALYEPIHVNNRLIATASNKTLEYMAAGLPLLVSDSASLRSLVAACGCGIAVSETDPSDIARGVNALCGDDAARLEMGARAACAFEQTYRFDRQFQPLVEYFDRVARQTIGR